MSGSELQCLDIQLFKTEYCFTEDWFSHKPDRLMKVLGHFRGKPAVRGLEVGPFEGMSSLWFLENVLTGENARLYSIDSYSVYCKECKAAQVLFQKNLKMSGYQKKMKLIRAESQQALKSQKNNSFDWIYIDGDPVAKSRLTDAILAWDLLKDGGILIIDDYDRSARLWLEQRPKYAIDTFVTLYRNEFQLLSWDEELIVKKQELCDNSTFSEKEDLKFFNRHHCVRFGRYDFYLKGSLLFDRESKQLTKISIDQNESLLGLLKSRKHGEYYFNPSKVKKLKAPEQLKKEIEKYYLSPKS